MKLLAALLVAAASAVAVAVAESVLDFSRMPPCAENCATLKTADSNCVPPAAPVTNQGTYQSCVCASALLTSLYGSSGALCQAFCSADDASTISQYYRSLCAGPVVYPSSTSTATSSTTATATTSTGTATAGAAGTASMGSSANTSWWSTHWKWVVMAIVMAVAIVVIWVGSALLRRHHNRKRDAERANMAASDAPYNPATPESKSTLAKITPAELSVSGGRDGVPPTPVGRPMTGRNRTNTLTSLAFGNSSRTHVSEPVVWGPHQHFAHAQAQAHGHANSNASSSVIFSNPLAGPPSPTVNVTPPNPIFRNHDAVMSEPRFVQYRATPTSVAVESTGPNLTPSASTSAASSGETIARRPSTAMGNETVRDVQAKRRTLSAVKSDPLLHEPQTAEICEPSPQKPNKLQKH